MAITSNQLAVGMFGVAAGGYKASIDAYMGAYGAVATGDALLSASGLNPTFLGQPLYNNAQFAAAVIARAMPGLSSSLQAAVANIVAAYMDANPTLSRGAVIVAVIEAVDAIPASDPTLGAAAAAFDAKVVLADAYTGTSTDMTVLAAVIGVTPVTQAGQTFTLTSGVDNITGTTGNDSITTTIVTGTPGSTFLNVFDAIDLGAGTDTVNINYGSTAATLSLAAIAKLNGVEVLGVSNLNGASTLVGTATPALTTLNISNSLATAGMTVTLAPATLLTLGLSDIGVDDNDLSVTYATGALSGASDAITLNVAGLSAATTGTAAAYAEIALIGPVSGSGFETLNVVSSSTSRLNNLTSTDGTTQTMTTLNVSGAGSFRVNTALDFKATSGTINASANTGGVTFVVGTENLTITGGTGNDTITFGTAGDLDASDTLSLGGGTDKIVLADTAVSSTTTALNTAINASTAEIIGFSAAASVDMSKVTATKVAMSSTTDVALTLTKMESTDTVVVDTGTNAAADLTAQGALGYTTLNVELNGTSSASVAIDNLDATSQSIVNIVSNGTKAGTANVLDNLNLSAITTVNITGAQALTITNALDNTAVKIDGAAMTGKLSVTAGTSASDLIGGSANDTLTGGTGADTITGGAGNDTINTGADGAVGTTITGGLGADSITSGHVAASAATIAYNATAAESYSSATATGTTSMDTLTMGNLADTGTTTVTFTTGVTPSSQTGSITVTSTAPTIGTTTVSAGGFIVYNAVAEVDTATAGQWFVYQDTDADGVIEQGEFAVKIVGTTDASDTEAFAVTSGKLVFTLTGV